jgi:hypothetical protein
VAAGGAGGAGNDAARSQTRRHSHNGGADYPTFPAIAETSQQDQLITTTATASTEFSVCSAAEGKAYNLCIVRGFFNITGVRCTCSQGAVAPIWECVGTATCKK